MIPGFDERGLLPPPPQDHGYTCTPIEVEQRFVLDLGSPGWRRELFQGWDLLRGTVAQLVPSACWWLWGCFVSNHAEPLYGEDQDLSSLVLLPTDDLPTPEQVAMLFQWLQGARTTHGVDVAIVFGFPEGHPDHLETMDALEMKWRPRALSNVADHITRELVPAGFLEVVP